MVHMIYKNSERTLKKRTDISKSDVRRMKKLILQVETL